MALYYPGETIAARYRVERELGGGGFGDVYEATELATGRRVAVKVLKPDDGPGYKPSTKARFEREAQAVRKLKSPHTVTLLDSGESDGKLFLVFELVGGEDLRAIIRREGRLGPALAVHILKQLLDSLGEAHRAGILHRDVKPANIRIFSTDDNRAFVKLLDFGLARPTDHGSPGITETGELIGTPRYMSPEQLRAQPLTPASDIYSLGIVFLEMLIGAAPLQGNRWADQFDRMMSGHVFSFPELQRLGPELVSAINMMTAVDPTRRPASTHAVLAHFGHAAPVREVGRRWPIAAGGTLAVLMAAAVVWWGSTPRDAPTPGEVRNPVSNKDQSPEPLVVAQIEPEPCAPTGWFVRDLEQRSVRSYVPRKFDRRDGPAIVVILADREAGFVKQSGFEYVADRENLVLVVLDLQLRGESAEDAWRDVEAVQNACGLKKAPVFLLGDDVGAEAIGRLLSRPELNVAAVATTTEHEQPPESDVPTLRFALGEGPHDDVVWSFFHEHRPRGCGAQGWQGHRQLTDGPGVWTPVDYDGDEKLPVLMFLVRKRSEAFEEFAQPAEPPPTDYVEATRFPTLATEKRFILVSPRLVPQWYHEGGRPQIQADLEAVKGELCVDDRRVFLVGDFDGGRSAFPLLCDPWVTASAVYAWLPGTDWNKWMCDEPKPMIWVSPRHSDRAPFDGPSPCADDDQPTVDVWESRWTQQNECNGRPDEHTYEGGACNEWSCTAPFTLCRIDGGYHWPHVESPPRSRLGTIKGECVDEEPIPTFEIEDVIWRFFEKAPALK